MDVGVEIGKYKVIEHIGRGGMADVWSARDQQLNRMVAIKTIAHGLSQDVDPVGLFKGEAQTIAQMEHPNILPIYDFGEFEGQLYIVMRFVAGGSLEDPLNRGPLSINEAMRVGQAIAEALDYAHANNIIHLDLKPPNVLLDSHNAPYLADFGLATKLDPEGKANNPGSGTLLYMAPEQLTAETIDKRADMYSFAIMMFHMLTGELPFDAAVPMALKQLQSHEELPSVDLINPDVPESFNDMLRRGTAVDPDDRYATLTEMVEDMRQVLSGVNLFDLGDLAPEAKTSFADLAEAFVDEVVPEGVDPEVLEAADIYLRAKNNWSGGNGRFLLGVTHFMLMNDYYMNADFWGLEIDLYGRQMLMRGALEYDQELDHWWHELDDDNRRWVCLHALRSGNAPARVRAMYRLETLTDSSPPQIPKLVAQALQVETDEAARLAALKVLGTRSKLIKETSQYDVKTEFRGRVLTTMTRIGIQVTPPNEWREVIYTPEIDLLIAETALDRTMPKVADYAARTTGRMRSKAAANYIADQQKEGRKGALRALALIRDEAPNLPEGVSLTGRIYAWLANTFRRMFEEPMGLVWRYVAAAIGGWIGLGIHLNAVQSPNALLAQARWANIIAMGLTFGVIVGFVAVVAHEFPNRLRKFWPWWARISAGLIAGSLVGAFAWWAWQWFFLKENPRFELVIFGGLGIALGYGITTLFKLRSWFAIPLTAFLTYAPIYITFEDGYNYGDVPVFQFLYYEALLPYNDPERIFRVGIPVAILIAIGGYFTWVLSDISNVVSLYRRIRAQRRFEEARMLPAVPDVSKYVPQAKAVRRIDAGDMRTELDVSLGNPDLSSEPVMATELDRELGAAPVADMRTELDVNLGMDAYDEDPQYETQSLNISTGLRLPLHQPNLKTELDANLGRGEDEEDDRKAKTDSQKLNIGTGLRVPVRKSEMGTELDLNLGDSSEDEEARKAKTDSQRLNVGTGIRIKPRDTDNMATEIDANKQQADETEDEEVRQPRFFASAMDSQVVDNSGELKTELDVSSGKEDEDRVRSPRFFAASRPAISQDDINTQVSPPQSSDEDDEGEAEVRKPRFFASNMQTELDPGKSTGSDEDETEARKPRFFTASRPPVNTDDMNTKIKPRGGDGEDQDETEVRKPRFFASSMKTELDPSRAKANAEDAELESIDSDDTEVRKPRFFAPNMNTEADAASRLRSTQTSETDRTTTIRTGFTVRRKTQPLPDVSEDEQTDESSEIEESGEQESGD